MRRKLCLLISISILLIGLVVAFGYFSRLQFVPLAGSSPKLGKENDEIVTLLNENALLREKIRLIEQYIKELEKNLASGN
ncbi:hypothetical protein [Desulfovibrio sp. DV]|uniref:hypothetical protein n=1 Tax=Desulfovibrio sp. DV TaxID=1844708 RepID=UPI000A54011E|nr:hypothetical protein [Desulfovibrio sp. DV]